MFDDYCTIEIDGNTYYVPSNLIQYLTPQGVNTSATSFYAYRNLSRDSTDYPYIRFNSNAYPILYTGYNSSQELRQASVTFSDQANLYRLTPYFPVLNTLLMVGLVIAVWFRRFK